jgi:DNA-binding CsgD family transcriptional regulator
MNDSLLESHTNAASHKKGQSDNRMINEDSTMNDATHENVFVMLCDWRGHVVWTSSTEHQEKVGQFAWTNLPPHYQELAKETLSKVASLRQSQTMQVENLQGRCFRCWLWPLDSPQTAICALLREVPSTLRELSDRELECLEMLAQGIETREVAERLDVSLSTVHTHMKRAREKLGLDGVEALISFAARYCYPSTGPLLHEETSTALKVRGDLKGER